MSEPKRILATMPGKFGDILWALPTVRALAETYGTRVDLCLSGKYGSIAELIRRQDYIGEVVVDAGWEVRDTAPMTPRAPTRGLPERSWDRVIHLGYDGWPTGSLPYDIARRGPAEMCPIDLARPWISVPAFTTSRAPRFAVGFTDEWFELKYGLWELVNRVFRPLLEDRVLAAAMAPTNISGGPPRWSVEAGFGTCSWEKAAQLLSISPIFFGCCSALHVLAVALGKPCVIMEPNPHRHHDIFYPLGKTGRVHLVTGNDGLPTHDARHCADAVKEALHATGQ